MKLFHSGLFGDEFLFVIYVLTELMLLVLNNQIVNVGRGLGRMCDLGVIFFFKSVEVFKEKMVLFKNKPQLQFSKSCTTRR